MCSHNEQGDEMLNSLNAASADSRKRIAAYFWIILATLLVFIWLGRLPPQRVGDGMEYYAMFLAWQDTLRPWMSAPSFASYQELYQSNHILGMLPASWLSESFPSLRLGATADFNHFWFYSFLAFAVGKMLHLVGLTVGPHGAFLALHFLLLSATAAVSYHLYGRRGVIVFFLMTLFSPMLWFSDKVHTELFTYCVTLMGVMFVFSRRYLAGAFCIALAATQNPSFALIAFIPFLYRFALQWRERFTLFEVCLVVGTAFAVLAHPLYYFLRFGVLTPQLLAGGATLGGNLSTFYIWIFDPDLGLLPNWPLGVLLTALAIVLRFAVKDADERGGDRWFYLFILVFFLVNFYAHSSTTNLNSGATPGLARYSLWYLPAFFPIIYYVVRRYPARAALVYPIGVLVLLVGAKSISLNNPKGHEQYSVPSWLSNAIQTKLPALYTPPFEVFVERYSGVGEAINTLDRRGVLGPDCHKLALFAGDRRGPVTVPQHCLMDVEKLKVVTDTFAIEPVERFVHLDETQYQQALLPVHPIKYSVGTAGAGNFVLASGWYDLEPWGVWSKGDLATISLPCNAVQYYANRDTLGMILDLSGFGSQAVTITQGGGILFSGKVGELKQVPLTLKIERCSARTLDLKIAIAKPVSPLELGVSSDPRKLGVGLAGFTLMP